MSTDGPPEVMVILLIIWQNTKYIYKSSLSGTQWEGNRCREEGEGKGREAWKFQSFTQDKDIF